MESTDSSYFTNMYMDPKPDLVILQNTTQGMQTKISEIFCSDQHKQSTFCGSTILYNNNMFQLVEELALAFQVANNDSQSGNSNGQGCGNETITVWLIKCLSIIGNPEVIVASFHNSTCSNDCVEQCFNLLSTTFPKYPILTAGGFNVELTRLKEDECGFHMTQYDPTLLRVLAILQSKNKQEICTDYFAYRSSTNTSIKLENVHAVSVVPCPGLVTGHGSYKCNIDRDKLPDDMPKHDPVRATMTISVINDSKPQEATSNSVTKDSEQLSLSNSSASE